MTDPMPEPEGQQPAAPEMPDYGASPDVIREALSVYNDLNNLDTRHQRLSQIVRPDIDGQFLRSFGEPQEEQDPYAQFYGQPEYEDPQGQYQQQYEPQQPVFDPRQLGDTIAQQVERRVFEQLGQMAQDQAVKDAAQSAVRDASLPPELAEMIEFRVKGQMQVQPNRQPADLAREIGSQLKATLSGWAAAPSANPAPTSAPPSGPAPSLQERAKDFDELARIAAENLRR